MGKSRSTPRPQPIVWFEESSEWWSTINPVLRKRENGYENDVFTIINNIKYIRFKKGDGVTRWNDLNYSVIENTMAFTTDLIQEIQSTGKYNGRIAKVYSIVGRRQGFNNTTIPHDLKEFQAADTFFTQLTGSESLEVVSSSANDSAAGTGIRSVKITYIDTDNNIAQSEPITLNGITPVAVPFNANEILWMESVTSGALRLAQGNIRLRIVAGVELEQITQNSSKSKTGKFMVPAGYTGFVAFWDGEAINNDQDMFILVQRDSETYEFSQAYHYIDNDFIATNHPSPQKNLGFAKVPALARIKISTISSGTVSTIRASGSFTIAIIKN